MTRSEETPKIYMVSLGCDKNRVDTEQMMTLLADRGYVFTEDASEADAAVVNTCCFIGDAKEESIQTIIELGELKESGSLKAMIVTGCLAQRYASEIETELPEADAVIGTTAFDRIAEVLEKTLRGEKRKEIAETDRALYVPGRRILTTGGHYAYLKIAEGCSKSCTYCIIPKIRGRYRSVPEEVLLQDARSLAEGGVKELIIVAQETTLYGTDLYGKKTLPKLLSSLCEVEGLEWIRLLYCYPEEITEELIRVMREQPKICRYLDLPIQHCSDRILKAMGRKTTKDSLIQIIETLRERIPDIALRTTLISGFPGETEEDHAGLLEFVRQMRFDRLGVFPYSREEGTAAYRMKNQIPKVVKLKRRNEVMKTQREIAFESASGQVSRIFRVMVEGRIPKDRVYVGRTFRDAPQIDGMIFFPDEGREYMSGDFVNVRVTGVSGYDLLGEIAEDQHESAE